MNGFAFTVYKKAFIFANRHVSNLAEHCSKVCKAIFLNKKKHGLYNYIGTNSLIIAVKAALSKAECLKYSCNTF